MNSDASKVIADLKKIVAEQKLTIDGFRGLGKVGASSGKDVETGLAGIAKAMAKLGKSSGADPGKEALAKLNAMKKATLEQKQLEEKAAADKLAAAKKASEEQKTLEEKESGRKFAAWKKNYLEQKAAEEKAAADKLAAAKKASEEQKSLEEKESGRKFAAWKKNYLEQKAAEEKAAADDAARSERQRKADNADAISRASAAGRKIVAMNAENRAVWLNSSMLNQAFTPAHNTATGAVNRLKAALASLRGGGGGIGGGGFNGFNRFMNFAALAGGVRGAAGFVKNANQTAMDESAVAHEKQEQQTIRFRAQASQDALKGRESQLSIMRAALRTSSTTEEASDAATSMVSTGFSPGEASGPSLVPFLQSMKANAVDPRKAISNTDMAESFAQFLNANKKDLNAQNVQSLGVQIQGLKDTPLKVTDLQQLAKQSSLLREIGGMSQEDQLSVYGMMRRVEDPEMAATHLREMTRQLATAGGSPKVVEQLGMLGMTPEDVNPKQHGLQNVLEKLNTAIAKLSTESERATAWDTLVEGRNISSALYTTQSAAEIRDLRKKMTGQAAEQQFAQDVAVTTTGQNAEIRREKVKLELFKSANDTGNELHRLQFEKGTQRVFESPVIRSAAMAYYDLVNGVAGHNAFMTSHGDGAVVNEQVRLMDRSDRERREIEETIKQEKAERAAAGRGNRAGKLPQVQVQAPVVNVQVNVNAGGNGAKAPPVAAAGLADKGWDAISDEDWDTIMHVHRMFADEDEEDGE